MLTQANFAALAEYRRQQCQPFEGDIRICQQCPNERMARATSTFAVGNLAASSEVSIMSITINNAGDSYGVVSHVDGSWQAGVKDGSEFASSGSFFMVRPALKPDGSVAQNDQWIEDAVSSDCAEQLRTRAREASATCKGLDPYKNCSVAQALAETLLDAIVQHSKAKTNLEND